ncbi:MAG: hypothetical protein HY399_03240 [Elusimicrobia bacterium]|nr:hypothetical protein [Elusimicrobiota bacterium]
MSQAGEELKKMMSSLSHEVEMAKQAQPTKSKVVPSLPRSSTPPHIFPCIAGIGISALISIFGLAVSIQPLAALGAIGTLAGAALLGFFWKQGESEGVGSVSSDIAVEVIKRRSLELERDRLGGELERTHRVIQQVEEKLMATQEEFVKERATQADAVAKREKELRDGFEMERSAILEQEKQRLAVFQGEHTEKEHFLEESLMRETQQLKQELANREKKLEELGQEVVRVQNALDQQALAASTTLTEHSATLNKSFEEERKASQKKLEDQEVAFQHKLSEQEASLQKKLNDAEAGHAHDRLELEKKLEELSQRATRLQEALDRKMAATSDEVMAHIDEMRKTYEGQKQALEQKLRDQEVHYDKLMEEQEQRFSARKAELLSACDGFLKELQAREDDLIKREQALNK